MEEVVDADYVYVMEKGKIVMDGTPRDIFSRVDELKEHRLDVPQATLVADELRSAGRTDSTGNPYEERAGGCDYVRGKCLDKDMRTGRR